MEEEAHVGDDDVVDVGEEAVGRVVAELSGSEGIEPADPAEETALLGEFVVDEGGDGSECDEPGPLDEVHLLE